MINKVYILLLILILVLVIYYLYNNYESFLDPSSGINYTIKVDALIPRPKEKEQYIIFRNEKWLLWNNKAHTTEMGPYGIINHNWFKKFPEKFQKGIDTIVARPTDPNRELIVFKDNQWLLWSFANDILISGPHNTGQHPWFKKLPDTFVAKIDCVIDHPQNYIGKRNTNYLLFFSGSNWLTWDFDKNSIVDGPYTIEKDDTFKNIPGLFKNSIDAGTLYGNNLLLFKADEWLIWNMIEKKLVSGPHKILGHPYFKKLGVHFIESRDDTNIQSYITLDKSGKGHHGILHNIEYVANIPKSSGFDKNPYDAYKEGKSIRFNGKTSYMEINNIKDLYKNGFSFAFYFMISNFTGFNSKEMVIAHSHGDITWEVKIQKNGHLMYRIKDKETGIWSVLFYDKKIKPEWYHVTIAQSSTEQYLHVNEIEIKKNNLMSKFPKMESNIVVGTGGHSPNYENYFDGVIGDIRIFNRSLVRNDVCKLSHACPDLDALEKDKEEEVIKKNVEDLDKCSFIPKGLREIDCFRSCNAERGVNDCKIEECLEKCSTCNDNISCKWLIPPEIIVKPEQKVDPTKPKECQFNPYGINKTFCVETCKGIDKANWGGDACTEKKCNLICGSCENPDTCQWLEQPKTFKETPPERPMLDGIAGDKEVILYWQRPNDGNNPIEKYTILIYETNNTQNGVSLILPEDYKCYQCSHIVKNLKNDTEYSFGISAANKIGMSKLSNIIVKKPEAKTLLEGFQNMNDKNIDNRLGTIKEYKNKKIYAANGNMTDNLIRQLIGKTVEITI